MIGGYLVIEPVGLADLCGDPKNFVVAVVVLEWLISELRQELPQLSDAQLDVIRVEYSGAYPALGLKCDGLVDDLAPAIEASIEKLLHERQVARLTDFVAKGSTDWGAKTTKLLG